MKSAGLRIKEYGLRGGKFIEFVGLIEFVEFVEFVGFVGLKTWSGAEKRRVK